MSHEPDPDEPESAKSVWATLPGVLAGIAAMLTALGALVAAIGATGLLGGPGSRPPAAASAPPPTISTKGDGSPVVTGTGGDVTIRSGD